MLFIIKKQLTVFLLLHILMVSCFLQVKACQLPDKMNGVTIILSVGEEYNNMTSFENDVIEMTFAEKSYRGIGYKNNRDFIGEYSYRKLAKNVSQIRTRELFGADILQYSINLVCQSDYEGYYLYAPSSGKTGPQIGVMVERYIVVQ